MASCCFTGHRTIPAKDFDLVRRGLEDEIDRLAEEGVEQFYAGGALGFDTLASLTVLMLKRRHQSIRLTLVLPCRDQAEKWAQTDQVQYEYIKSRADEVIYTAEEYHKGCMQKRNRYLVDSCDYLIAVWDGTASGTGSTVRYAQENNKSIIIINPNELSSGVD